MPLGRSELSVHLPRSLRSFALALAVLFGLCVVVIVLCRTVLHLHHEPYSVPWMMEYFPDILLFQQHFRTFHSPQFFQYHDDFRVMYPAPVAVFYNFFYLDWAHPERVFVGFVAIVYAVAGTFFARCLRSRGIAVLEAFAFPAVVLFCSYPIWFDVRQGNMEIVVWVMVALGVALFLGRRGYSAAACFGIAASMKIFPIVYLGLFLARRQYRQIVVGIAAAAAVTLASLWLVCPPVLFAWRQTNLQLDRFREIMMLRLRPEGGFDHSLFAFYKLLASPLPPAAVLAPRLTAYLAIVALLGIALFFGRIRRLPLFNQVLCLTVASILFPPTSYEYTLQHLLTPLAILVLLLVDARRRGVTTFPSAASALACFAVLLGFLPELIFHGRRIEGQVKCLVLLLLFGIGLWKPFVLSPADAEAESQELNTAWEWEQPAVGSVPS